MHIVLNAAVALKPGCLLCYSPPPGCQGLESERFFNTYRGKHAAFVGYCECLAGPLDHLGRLPGRYIDPRNIQVRFEGESEVHTLNSLHFIALDAQPASSLPTLDEPQRLGELSQPVLFYPEDSVRFVKKPQPTISGDPHRVVDCFLKPPFCMDGIPRYQIVENEDERRKRLNTSRMQYEDYEWRFISGQIRRYEDWKVPAEDLELVSRGSVWTLYHEPSALSFASDSAESAFWERTGVSRKLGFSTLAEAWVRFIGGEADLISACTPHFFLQEATTHEVYVLHECFAQHRGRVRALTERLWGSVLEHPVML